MWFLLALASTLLWGAADLFYKRGADGEERYSHLKTSIAVGLVMGLHAILTLIFGGTAYDFRNILYYLPVSLCYILSMTVGYLGLRYLALSVSSPVQNTVRKPPAFSFVPAGKDHLSGSFPLSLKNQPLRSTVFFPVFCNSIQS